MVGENGSGFRVRAVARERALVLVSCSGRKRAEAELNRGGAWDGACVRCGLWVWRR